MSSATKPHPGDAAPVGEVPVEAERASWAAGRQAWPGVDLPATSFARHLARLPPDRVQAAGGRYSADLYLACACAEGIPSALAAFDARYLAKVPSMVARLRGDEAFADEVRQRLRHRLLIAGEGPPKIAGYCGDAPLAAWLRVIALREAIDLRRQQQTPGREVDLDVAAALPVSDDPAALYLLARHGREFQEALREAIKGLPLEQRNVLRLHHAGGLTGERIAAVLQVSRPTVVRWLASARQGVLLETKRLLQERLRITPADLESLIRAMRSGLDVSLSALFAGDGGPA